MRPLQWLVCITLAFTPGWAEAADKAGPKQAASELVNEGNRLMKEGKFGAALARYQGAYEVYPSPKLFFNFGEAERELGHAEIAAEHYEKFLDVAGVDPKSPLAQEAKRHLLALDATLGRVDFSSEPAGAELFLDGRAIGRAPLLGVRVAPGSHTVLGQLPGYESSKTTLEVKPGLRHTMAVRLGSVAVAAAPPEAPAPPPAPAAVVPPPPPPPPPLTTKAETSVEEESSTPWWLWAGLGVLAVGAAVSVGVVAASGGGEEPIPGGDLGADGTSMWMPR